ncbi:autophagy-related protein 16-2-like isoform X1 [Solea senegalensis]|uniref:Autophagy-related protein 16-2-like isoform X1 n=1 Tax=Solea senegalensis TaxID=28829 RepID=A0AAV6Q1A4_SOLSE|nr:protein Atg16l2-like isoform X1 [Solea senegalensis]KAG7479720.1 autophagy-related protein 16-2-like isoform X1 [Solea senegalensis]
MAAVTVSPRSSERSGRVLAAGGDTWKRHIVRQLKHRDRNQHAMFQDLINFYTQLLDKASLTKGILSSSTRQPCSDSNSISALLQQKNQLNKTTGELAYQVVELQQQIKIKECVLEEQHARLQVVRQRASSAFDAHHGLRELVEQVQKENGALKMEYDALLERQREAESRLREEKFKEVHLLEDMIHQKRQAAARMNSRNERKTKAREANLQRELQSAAMSEITIDSVSAPNSRSTSPEKENQDVMTEQRHTRLFRSASATSVGILTSLRGLFEKKRRGHSVCSPDEDRIYPVGICMSARVPARALQVLEAHEESINTVRFSSSSDMVATGGTDKVIKLWDIQAGLLTHRATLDGSTEGITCVEFDPVGSRVLAASYDRSALLWRLDDSVPKLTLTGHTRKVTAARFSGLLHQVVTGSADGTIRVWDLHRAACVQVVEVSSYCSDLVCAENCIISGHYDSKIRVWDSRAVSCVQELPSQGKVTSLDLSCDHRQLLSCCRDNCLQLVDLRRWSERVCFRAEGFTCGSDSTKAVISPDGCFVVAGSADGAVYIWNVSTGDLETRLPDKHSSSISAVSWSLSGKYVVSVDKSRRAVLWSDF